MQPTEWQEKPPVVQHAEAQHLRRDASWNGFSGLLNLVLSGMFLTPGSVRSDAATRLMRNDEAAKAFEGGKYAAYAAKHRTRYLELDTFGAVFSREKRTALRAIHRPLMEMMEKDGVQYEKLWANQTLFSRMFVPVLAAIGLANILSSQRDRGKADAIDESIIRQAEAPHHVQVHIQLTPEEQAKLNSPKPKSDMEASAAATLSPAR